MDRSDERAAKEQQPLRRYRQHDNEVDVVDDRRRDRDRCASSSQRQINPSDEQLRQMPSALVALGIFCRQYPTLYRYLMSGIDITGRDAGDQSIVTVPNYQEYVPIELVDGDDDDDDDDDEDDDDDDDIDNDNGDDGDCHKRQRQQQQQQRVQRRQQTFAARRTRYNCRYKLLVHGMPHDVARMHSEVEPDSQLARAPLISREALKLIHGPILVYRRELRVMLCLVSAAAHNDIPNYNLLQTQVYHFARKK